MSSADSLTKARPAAHIKRNRRGIIATLAITALMFAGLIPATSTFADTSTVTLTITAPPVTRTSLDWVFDPAIDGDALVLTTSVIGQLP
jgi:hypothetical protein